MISFAIDLDGYCTEISNEALALLGYQEASELLSRDIHSKIHHTTEFGQKHDFSDCDLFHALTFQQSYTVNHVRFWKNDGSCFFADLHIDPVFQNHVLCGAKVLLKPISTECEVKASLHRMAYFDTLTGLPNRETLFTRSKEVLKQTFERRLFSAVLFLDLDRFKETNDTYGHAVGDALLQSISQRLQSCVRRTDLVSRLGGDEFVILLSDLKSIEESELVARKILRIFEEPFRIDKVQLMSGVSIGISVSPDAGKVSEFQTMLTEADAAMYAAKRQGKNQFCRFSAAMGRSLDRHLALERELRAELVSPVNLSLYYQPIVDLQRLEVVGVESLARWTSTDFGVIAPHEFLSIAENSGLMSKLDSWILEEACKTLSRWKGTTLQKLWLTVNVSDSQLRSANFPDQVLSLCKEYWLSEGVLGIEVSGSSIIAPSAAMSSNLTKLSDFGIQIIVDNFGLGAISVQSLHQLPISMLKVDREFVRQLREPSKTSTKQLPLASVLTQLSSLFNLATLAAGVETPQELESLKQIGCSFAQGYLFSAPIPEQSLQHYVENSQVVLERS